MRLRSPCALVQVEFLHGFRSLRSTTMTVWSGKHIGVSLCDPEEQQGGPGDRPGSTFPGLNGLRTHIEVMSKDRLWGVDSTPHALDRFTRHRRWRIRKSGCAKIELDAPMILHRLVYRTDQFVDCSVFIDFVSSSLFHQRADSWRQHPLLLRCECVRFTLRVNENQVNGASLLCHDIMDPSAQSATDAHLRLG